MKAKFTSLGSTIIVWCLSANFAAMEQPPVPPPTTKILHLKINNFTKPDFFCYKKIMDKKLTHVVSFWNWNNKTLHISAKVLLTSWRSWTTFRYSKVRNKDLTCIYNLSNCRFLLQLCPDFLYQVWPGHNDNNNSFDNNIRTKTRSLFYYFIWSTFLFFLISDSWPTKFSIIYTFPVKLPVMM